MGLDKGSLTEHQTKGTVATTILIRRIYKTNSKMHRSALTPQCPSSLTPPPRPRASSPTQNPAWCHMVSNTPFCLAILTQPATGFWWKSNLSWMNPGHHAILYSTCDKIQKIP